MNQARARKKLVGLIDKIIDLIDEDTQIFFDERPFLEDRSQPMQILDFPERRVETSLAMRETLIEADKTFKKLIELTPKKVVEQKSLPLV